MPSFPGLTETFGALRTDRRRLIPFIERKFGFIPWTWWLEPAFVCVLLFRFSHLCQTLGFAKGARALMQLNSVLTGADIHPNSIIGLGLLIPSPCGMTFSGKAGEYLTLMPLSGTGGSFDKNDVGAGNGLPVLGDHVVVNRFAGVQGAIRVGSHVRFRSGACATSDIPSHSEVELVERPAAGRIPDPEPHLKEQNVNCDSHSSWGHCKENISADIDRYLRELALYHPVRPSRRGGVSAFLSTPCLAVFFYRLAHWQFASHRRCLALLLTSLNALLFKINIHPASCIGPGLYIPHPTGIVFNGIAGRELSIFDNSLCSSLDGKVVQGLKTSPELGDDVSIGGHAGVFGPIVVGDHVRIAPKVQVSENILPNTLVFSPMARSKLTRSVS